MARDDVLIVGNGPAGLAAAAACCDIGLCVSVLGLDFDAEWPNTYGIWEDELAPLGLGQALAMRWPQATVHLGEPTPRRIARAYGRLDNHRLRHCLLERVARGGGCLRAGKAAHVEHDGAGSVVTTAEGARLPARLVIDASGHRPALLSHVSTGPAYQAAYGVLGHFSAPPVEPGSMVLMDYRDDHLPDTSADGTFLYAMDLGGGRFFVEETSLARRPALGFDVLEARLRRRLGAAGVAPTQILAVERCLFPMGQPLPSRRQRVVGYGAAAGMVHPATGYQVGAALQRAPRLASALASALQARGASPASVAAAGWAAVWPDDLVRQRALHELGLEALLLLDGAQLRTFFGAFFDLPMVRMSGYLSGAGSAQALATTMLMLFARAPWGLRLALSQAGFAWMLGRVRR